MPPGEKKVVFEAWVSSDDFGCPPCTEANPVWLDRASGSAAWTKESKSSNSGSSCTCDDKQSIELSQFRELSVERMDELAEVFFGGEAWVVLCDSKTPNARVERILTLAASFVSAR